ncbi:hypothetical protein EZS27_008292, partial [termite gut metagenome]
MKKIGIPLFYELKVLRIIFYVIPSRMCFPIFRNEFLQF